jgi:hypothetical protein
MIGQLRDNWKSYAGLALISLWIIVFAVIFYASAQAGCSDNVALSETRGICLGRRIAGLSCFAGYLGVWTWVGGLVAIGKGRNPAVGWILGFTLEFMGCLLMMSWEPRRDNAGRMIGWDEYKRFSKEQREAIRPAPVPVSPELERRRIVVIVIAVVATLVMILQVLRNLGKI